ncbi:hypothetical protein Riv7116_2012 [Rivularia sp. PCC 7116]|uniref:hypothetical protein n=1 Tax=Rivularia sp. PCC 7116 TaxID=373994 RepID=UPI00029EC6AD|nr:hypothetical protein [Rivularia sp. PCC 7116]AFY54549.1 hypothetical protein Riv7116_2012 [Rivularia sp. PCC 7116]
MKPESQQNLETPPQALLEPLLGLREYYARLVQEYEVKVTTARIQLAHVEALLSNSSALINGKSFPGLEILDVTAITQTSPYLSKEALESQLKGSSTQETDSVEKGEDTESEPDTGDEPDATASDDEDTQPEIEEDETTQASKLEKASSSKSKYNAKNSSEIQMLPEFRHISRIEAIKQLLEENRAKVCHIDFVVRSLYGDLESTAFKVVKGRVHSSLTHGKEQMYWESVPDEPGCYTLDLSLVVPPGSKSKSKKPRPKAKKQLVPQRTKKIPMLPQYEGQFLIDAISSFLEENSGKIYSVSEIIEQIYGALDDEEIRDMKIRSMVLGELSRGYRIGRFARVPNKLGYYTWDLDTVDAA